MLNFLTAGYARSDTARSSSPSHLVNIFFSLQGMLCRTLQGHGHWVNILALSTDYVMRTGAYDPRNADIVHTQLSLSSKCSCFKLQTVSRLKWVVCDKVPSSS